MKIIVTHNSPDMDGITSIWLLKRFLDGWQEAEVKFVPAGERLKGSKDKENAIEKIGNDEVIHVDTGMGALDHHQTESSEVSAASVTWDYVKDSKASKFGDDVSDSERVKVQKEAISRMVKVVVDIDHFKEVFRPDATADYHEFSLFQILEGLKFEKPGDENYFVEFGMECLDAALHVFENRIWAEHEIKEKGIEFKTRFGKGIGFQTLNDSSLKLAQMMGFVIALRKDPRKEYVKIKARPKGKLEGKDINIDLTLAYEKLSKMDPEATWFLHVSKKMLLNGTVKNPKMRPTKLKLEEIIEVLKKI